MKRVTKRPRGRPPHADLLTPAEWRTVHAVQHGMTNAEIARRRGVSVNAVKFHMANALAKLNLRNRRELRAWFRAPNDSALAGRNNVHTWWTGIVGCAVFSWVFLEARLSGDGGLQVFSAQNGNPGIVPTTIPVDRGGYSGRVDVAAVGMMLVETRGGTVVGLSPGTTPNGAG